MAKAQFACTHYRMLNRMPIGSLYIELSLDGWMSACWSHKMDITLTPAEIQQFASTVDAFMANNKRQELLNKFARSIGTKLKTDGYESTYAMNIDGDLLDFVVHITGNKVTFFAYRKEEN